jgi:hypothetical protein
VRWLLAKDPRIKQDTLPTAGRNIVLHFLCLSEEGGASTPRQEAGEEVEEHDE